MLFSFAANKKKKPISEDKGENVFVRSHDFDKSSPSGQSAFVKKSGKQQFSSLNIGKNQVLVRSDEGAYEPQETITP